VPQSRISGQVTRLAKAEALNFSEQVQKFRHRFAAESAVEKRAMISKGGLMVRLLAFVVPVVLLLAFFTTIAPAQTAGGNTAPAPAVADRHATPEPSDVSAAVDAYLAKMPPQNGLVPMPISKAVIGCSCGISSRP